VEIQSPWGANRMLENSELVFKKEWVIETVFWLEP
jgi:hypothetical protein